MEDYLSAVAYTWN